MGIATDSGELARYWGMPVAVIRVLVLDDHEIFAASLARTLADESDIQIVGAVTSIPTALAAIEGGVDVVLSDMRLADGDGVSFTRTVVEQWPAVRVVMLTAWQDEAVLADAIDAGCTGFVTKTESLETVLAAIRGAAQGEAVITPSLLARLLPKVSSTRASGPNPDLTPREGGPGTHCPRRDEPGDRSRTLHFTRHGPESRGVDPLQDRRSIEAASRGHRHPTGSGGDPATLTTSGRSSWGAPPVMRRS